MPGKQPLTDGQWVRHPKAIQLMALATVLRPTPPPNLTLGESLRCLERRYWHTGRTKWASPYLPEPTDREIHFNEGPKREQSTTHVKALRPLRCGVEVMPTP